MGGICPRVCRSDWDKRETPFVSTLLIVTYEWRFQAPRRGQESLDGCLPVASRS